MRTYNSGDWSFSLCFMTAYSSNCLKNTWFRDTVVNVLMFFLLNTSDRFSCFLWLLLHSLTLLFGGCILRHCTKGNVGYLCCTAFGFMVGYRDLMWLGEFPSIGHRLMSFSRAITEISPKGRGSTFFKCCFEIAIQWKYCILSIGEGVEYPNRTDER